MATIAPICFFHDNIENDEGTRSAGQRKKLGAWLVRVALKLGPPDVGMDKIYVRYHVAFRGGDREGLDTPGLDCHQVRGGGEMPRPPSVRCARPGWRCVGISAVPIIPNADKDLQIERQQPPIAAGLSRLNITQMTLIEQL